MMQRNRVIRVSNFEYSVRKLLAYIVYILIVGIFVMAGITALLFIHWLPEFIVSFL